MEQSIQKIHEAGGVAIAAHPTAFYKSPASRKVACYDAVEVMNAASFPFPVLTHYSKKFSQKLNLPQTGGSDSHYAPEIGAAYTVVDADPEVDEIANAIIRGATIPMGKGIPLNVWMKRTISRLKKKS